MVPLLPPPNVSARPARHSGPTIEQMLKTLSYIDRRGAKGLRLDMDCGITVKTIMENADVELGGQGVQILKDTAGKALIRYVALDKSTKITFYYDHQRSIFGMNSLDNLKKLHQSRIAALS